MNQRISFNPRLGFIIQNITLKDSGYFKCLINLDDENPQEVDFALSVISMLIRIYKLYSYSPHGMTS